MVELNNGKKKSKVLGDGERITVKLHMMDGMSREIATHFEGLAASGQSHGLAMTDADTAQRIQRQQDYEARITDAWKSPTAIAPASTGDTPAVDLTPRGIHDAALIERWRDAR